MVISEGPLLPGRSHNRRGRTNVGRAAARATRQTRIVDPRSLVFDRMADGVIVTDLDGRVIDWNPAASRIFGYSKEEMLGRTVARLYRIDDPARLEAAVLEEIDASEGWTGELRFVHRDGREGIAETCVFALRDEGGRRVATVGVNRDVTERRRIESALAESYSMLEAVVEGATDAVFVKDMQGRYVMINSAGARLFGRPRKDVLGRDDTDVFPAAEASEIRQIDHRVMESGHPYAFEETVTLGERPTRFSTTKVPWRDAQGRIVGLIGIARDITSVWQAEEESRRHQAELAHALRVQTMGEMAAGLAHEINQPLAAIANYAKGCARRLRSGDNETNEVLAVVDEIALQALRAGAIVHRLGEFVRNRPARRQVANLNDLIRAAVRLVEPDAAREGIRVTMKLGRPAQVEVDPIQIEQVLLNLMRNGVEAMRDDRPERALLIRSTIRARSVQIEVTDTGPGLRDSEEAIFSPFYSTKPDGMGMGLTISRSIIEAHSGRLWAAAPNGRGASFRVELRRC
jgi:PAS domain S-box-containing protein